MKYLFKKYWMILVFALIINVPIFVLGITRTNKALTLKGDTTIFNSVVSIDTQNEEKGSFSSIYVISMNHSTLLQNIICKNDPIVDVYEMSTSSTHINDIENYNAGKIQFYSSIENALIVAYNKAKLNDSSINLDYSFVGFDVTYYGADSQFRINDRIIKIKTVDDSLSTKDNIVYKEVDYKDEMAFRAQINSKKYINDEYTIIRDGVEMVITLKKMDIFSSYSRYNINYEASSPKISFNDNTTGGPSGGLLQTLSIYNRLIDTDLTHGLKIAGTGTISYDGKVGGIGGITQKVPTAFDDDIDIFFCPKVNWDDAIKAYNTIPNRNKMKMVCVETLDDALNYLMEGYKNDFSL